MWVENDYINYRGAYGDSSKVPLSALDFISTSANGMGKSDVVFAGHGSELARVKKLPTTWADAIMNWAQQQISQYKRDKELKFESENPAPTEQQIDPIEKIKKLSELKAAGIITEEEFNIKKAELFAKV
jgi:hypothetical protein